mmetsp:Transcript_20132/g.57126  ORF Transcript_20132/g.57126 Transcript_20132/m.57126 type:complete len:89 (-) Transcript_20132:17-283(-)
MQRNVARTRRAVVFAEGVGTQGLPTEGPCEEFLPIGALLRWLHACIHSGMHDPKLLVACDDDGDVGAWMTTITMTNNNSNSSANSSNR